MNLDTCLVAQLKKNVFSDGILIFYKIRSILKF